MTVRVERVQKAILHILQPALRQLKDPEIAGFITLTEVRLSKDFKTALVYFSVLGTPEERKATERALERSAGYLRHLVAEELPMRRVPALRFQFDPTPERADRIDRILHKLDEEKAESGPEEAGSASPEEKDG